MKKALAIIMVLLSIPFLLLGILFAIAAATGPGSRLIVGLVLLAGGVGLLVGGLRWLRRQAEMSPDALKTGAVELAQRLGGELTLAQFRAEYSLSQALGTRILNELVREGTANIEQRGDRAFYIFGGLRPSLATKVCPYCGTELPVRSALRKCPNCGGQLEVAKS
jgi:hypothetical protein